MKPSSHETHVQLNPMDVLMQKSPDHFFLTMQKSPRPGDFETVHLSNQWIHPDPQDPPTIQFAHLRRNSYAMEKWIHFSLVSC